MKIISRNKVYTFTLALLTVLCGAFLILFPSTSQNAVAEGISICLNVLIPSLFPFMVVSVFLNESGLINSIFAFPSKLLSRFTHVNTALCNIFFVGMIGGYPSAAKNISVCLKNGQIDCKTAEILLCFCTNAGPSFLISAVGSKMFLSPALGVVLYVASLLSSVTMMLIYSPKLGSFKINPPQKRKSISKSLIASVKSCCSSMLMICALVLLFSSVLIIAEKATTNLGVFKAVICGCIEVTRGCILASNDFTLVNILSVSTICSFGGFCVIMQIKAICSDYNISLKKFIQSRLLNVLLNLIYVFLLLFFIPIKAEETFVNNSPSAVFDVFSSPLPAFILLICCVAFPICLSKRKNF